MSRNNLTHSTILKHMCEGTISDKRIYQFLTRYTELEFRIDGLAPFQGEYIKYSTRVYGDLCYMSPNLIRDGREILKKDMYLG